MSVTDPYLDARDAAIYVGYKPALDAQGKPVPADKDPQMSAFYKFVRRHDVQTTRRGRRLLFRRSWLDRALARCDDEQLAQQRDRMTQIGELAKRLARGESRESVPR